MITDPFQGRTVHFLTGSQDLYGPEILAQVADQSRRVAEILDADPAIPVRVLWQPVLTNSDDIYAACRRADADPDCVGVIAWMHTFSPAKMWIKGLDALTEPLLHLHTQADQSLPWSTIDMDFMNLNQAAHGDREFGHIRARLGGLGVTVVGAVQDPATRMRVGAWSRAAAARSVLRDIRVARFGDNMRGVAVTEGDKVAAQIAFGVSIDTFGVNDLTAIVDGIAEQAVDELVAQYLDGYAVAEELTPGGVRHDALRYAARIEAGLSAFLADGGFDAFTTNFEDLGSLRQLPGLAVQRLMSEGYGFGAEGDWKTSLLLRAVKALGSGLPGGTSFMEDYTYHFGPGPQRILGAHMLEVCPSIAGDRPRIEIHPLGVGNREDPVRMRFCAAPGPGIVVGLADLGHRFRLTANVIDVVAPDEPLERLPVACAVWEPTPSLATSAECWIAAGAPHHSVLSTSVDAALLHLFADQIGCELALIDADTTGRGFARDLQLGELYHGRTRR